MSIDIYGDMFGMAGSLSGDEAAFFGGLMIAYLGVMLVSSLFGIACYVLQSLGFYSIAKRRGIHHPWLAWIPVGNMWILGSIADQYQYVAKGKIRSRRKVLLGLQIAMAAATVLFMIFGFVAGFSAGMADTAMGVAGGMVGPVLLFIIFYLAFMTLAVVLAVFQYIALYSLFASCDPNNAAVFLVLSILFNVTLPIFVFVVRKKDRGMPPRRQPTPAEPPYIPVAEPVVEDPVTYEPAPEVVEAEPEDFED